MASDAIDGSGRPGLIHSYEVFLNYVTCRICTWLSETKCPCWWELIKISDPLWLSSFCSGWLHARVWLKMIMQCTAHSTFSVELQKLPSLVLSWYIPQEWHHLKTIRQNLCHTTTAGLKAASSSIVLLWNEHIVTGNC